jgi:hypothetical protein
MKKPERKDLSWRERLALAVAGVWTVVYGYGQILLSMVFCDAEERHLVPMERAPMVG